ncbi:hypothetical protein IFM89_035323 [Coptis chinensis]|uniref:Uncharacterized protein n=1 Tax=Coptis chinensis TaxID=261450 RepID=A0A835IJ44_9MAGN|nr:hypothetical protein IFM89_035323 [Coptis chinensis]
MLDIQWELLNGYAIRKSYTPIHIWSPPFPPRKAIQVGAAKVLSVLCVIAENTQPYKFGNVSLVSDDKQDILSEETPKSEDLFVAILKLLTSAARYQGYRNIYESFLQPAFLVSIIAPKENVVTPLSNGDVVKQPPVKASLQSLELKKINIIDALLHYVQSSKDFFERYGGVREIASNMFLVHVMEKVITGDTGSLSLSLLRKIQYISKELCGQPSFSELLVQYSQHGYSGGKELNSLILSNLYYHLQDRKHNYKRDFLGHVSDVYVFDLVCIRKDLGLPFWDHLKWEASKEIVEKMLSYMQDANLMSFFLSSKLRALKALATILSVYGGNWTEIKTGSIGRGMSETFLSSCVEGVCKCLQTTVESLVSAVGPSADIINFFGAQAELLLCLIRLLCKRFSEKTNRLLSLHIFALVLKTSATSLRVLCSIVPSMDALVAIMNFFLLALLLSAECFQSSSSFQEKEDKKSAEAFTEVSLLCLGLLPILCSCTEIVDCCNLSVALMDLILNGFLTSSTWLPIIQKHLRGAQCIAESSGRTSPLLCPPVLKEEVDLNRKPSFINCKHGWFSLLPIGCVPRTHSRVFSSTVLVPFCADQTAQTTEAANRAEEMGFINLAHFPELPMPEILHGLQVM